MLEGTTLSYLEARGKYLEENDSLALQAGEMTPNT